MSGLILKESSINPEALKAFGTYVGYQYTPFATPKEAIDTCFKSYKAMPNDEYAAFLKSPMSKEVYIDDGTAESKICSFAVPAKYLFIISAVTYAATISIFILAGMLWIILFSSI